MKASGKAVMRGSVATGIVLLVVGVVWGNVFVTNKLIEENGDPITITPTTPLKGERGDRGPQGEKGDAPTTQQVRLAVADYCAASGLCEGKTPSASVVYAAVTRYCTENDCRGEIGQAGKDGTPGSSGRDGRDGAPVTEAQIQAQVAAYCTENNCAGTTGPEGPAGPDGQPGTNGRTAVLACVVRDGAMGPVNYVAWRYEDEPDTSYRDIYQVPPLGSCPDPVDVRI